MTTGANSNSFIIVARFDERPPEQHLTFVIAEIKKFVISYLQPVEVQYEERVGSWEFIVKGLDSLGLFLLAFSATRILDLGIKSLTSSSSKSQPSSEDDTSQTELLGPSAGGKVEPNLLPPDDNLPQKMQVAIKQLVDLKDTIQANVFIYSENHRDGSRTDVRIVDSPSGTGIAVAVQHWNSDEDKPDIVPMLDRKN